MSSPQLPDVKAVRLRARIEWERTARRKISIQERIGQSVAWWLVLIAAAFFVLSAPHTIDIMNRLAPGWGWIAPVGVECCLLYAAYTRRKNGGEVSRIIQVLEAMAFVASVVVNAAGAFVAVVNSAGIANESFVDLARQFSTLPASSEVSLVLVPLFALMIPVGTGVAGEGVAALILERRADGDLLDQQWRTVRFEVEYLALRDEAIRTGVSPDQAALWAKSIAQTDNARLPKSASGTLSTVKSDAPDSLTTVKPDGKSDAGVRSLKEQRVIEWFTHNPTRINEPSRALAEEIGGVSHETVNSVRRQFSSNGHSGS